MPFKSLKRLFSKKKKPSKPAVSNTLPIIPESGNDSAEVAAIQLLRSSSARYAVVRELDYTSLPPISHPINRVLPTPPTSSTASLASATSSINSTRGTYTVKVHQRRRHTSTEFPNANCDLEPGPLRQNNNSQLLGLRSDPSVASLLQLYDEHGQLPTGAFSNSPPREGRAQVARSGSTLRQLLGNPLPVPGLDTSDLGDISWAEQFLGETESIASTVSSPGITTPPTDARFAFQDPRIEDASTTVFENAGISSLEVELSDVVETPPRTTSNRSPYAVAGPSTPQRASQVFGFLTKRRQSKDVDDDDQRSLPDLPSALSSPSSEEISPPADRSRSHFSSGSGSTRSNSRPSTPTDISSKPANDVHVLLPHGPTKVIVTAPTPSQHHDTLMPRPLRGPRAHHRQRSSQYGHRDLYTTLPARRHVSRGSHRSSLGSISVTQVDQQPATPSRERDETPKKGKRRSILAVFEKENHMLTAKQELPRTPIRSGSISRPLPHRGSLRASPAKSLELSETGKRMMAEERVKGYSRYF
ncbi:hypothetical protein MIND_00351600 [Mycena indigotica]|uniref:Uncharacterized protein n=1 Tax=Mycena indigotica TaxID=2126181 RepID=A0A8H6W9K5_9AGAR|nr:uncharacterized protein MIND_00351600 [Mycena indigotica]KAF7309797.1 hypothetical protein MIND_00351600 [Mycena indigotica]